MEEINEIVFFKLFREASEKCFGYPLTAPLSEADSKLLSIKIQEHTGLVIGVKSIRNYSLFMFGNKEGKKENPSIATLDTFARYVLNAPYTNEVQRKNDEGHHPYWFQYKSTFYRDDQIKGNTISIPWKKIAVVGLIAIAILTTVFLVQSVKSSTEDFTDNFNDVSKDSLQMKGWKVQLLDTIWWNKRQQKPGHLSLYTLRGDNWKSMSDSVGIKNLLVRKLTTDCFTTEIHLSDFFPSKNWQQAGILLSEDESFSGKVIRLSISYNDFFGGYESPPEIIIQGLSSTEGAKQAGRICAFSPFHN